MYLNIQLIFLFMFEMLLFNTYDSLFGYGCDSRFLQQPRTQPTKQLLSLIGYIVLIVYLKLPNTKIIQLIIIIIMTFILCYVEYLCHYSNSTPMITIQFRCHNVEDSIYATYTYFVLCQQYTVQLFMCFQFWDLCVVA